MSMKGWVNNISCFRIQNARIQILDFRLKAPIFQSLSDHQISVNTKDEIGTGRYILHKSISAEIVHISEASEFSYTQVVNRIKVYHEVSKIAHANVLKFYGTWVETDVLHLGFEAISDTNLVDYLRQSRQSRAGNAMSTLTNYQLLKLLYEISNGLLHLHNRNIIHGNLQGILVSVFNSILHHDYCRICDILVYR